MKIHSRRWRVVRCAPGVLALMTSALGCSGERAPVEGPRAAGAQALSGASWSATPPMVYSHYGHVATSLADGRVLVFGGKEYGPSNDTQPGTEVYDPATGAWSTRATPPTQWAPTLTLLADGKVLEAGGFYAFSNPISAVYDPAANAWTQNAGLTDARSWHVAARLGNGKVIVAGGVSGGFSALASAEIFDPATSTWSAVQPMAEARWAGHTATALGSGKVLVVGGYDTSNVNAKRSAEIYDPAANAWSSAGTMAAPRAFHTATALADGRVLVAGGYQGNVATNPTSSAELYNPATNTWSPAGAMTSARAEHAAALLSSGKVLAAGGDGSAGGSEIYNPATNAWSAGPSLTTARTGPTATLLNSGKVLVAGGMGQGSTGPLSSAEIYSPMCTVQIAQNGHTGCALKADGSVWCWGYNDSGQVGDGTTVSPRPTPVQVAVLGTGVVEIAVGYWHACARKADGTVWCWGRNANGQVGDGTTVSPKLSPVQVTALGTSAVQITAGDLHTCARKADGTAWCWGANWNGQTGDGTTFSPRPTPVQVATLGTNVVEITAGGADYACARKADGSVWCWGRNDLGQLGDGTTTMRPFPVQVTGLGTSAVEIVAGYFQTCARKADGTAWCWGSNGYAECGDGVQSSPRLSPVQAAAVGTSVVQLAAGFNVTCARKADGTAWCWGRDDFGQLGDGTTTIVKPTPVQVASLGTSAAQIVVSCAIKADGSPWCWGYNGNAEVGDGTTVSPRPSPVPVALSCP